MSTRLLAAKPSTRKGYAHPAGQVHQASQRTPSEFQHLPTRSLLDLNLTPSYSEDNFRSADRTHCLPENFPSILFATLAIFCAALALTESRVRPRLALYAGLVAAFAMLCFAVNHAWARYSIRIDLFLTIPLVSIAALMAGSFAIL
ncbi:MAG: hypothetical protein JWM69_1323, partial [Candidatus Binatus sp.]|nr:hypothetical protein [Candidatus Binatus sp.]